jgi:hypothetical protein
VNRRFEGTGGYGSRRLGVKRDRKVLDVMYAGNVGWFERLGRSKFFLGLLGRKILRFGR